MKSQRINQQGRGGDLPGWAIELIQIAIAILIIIVAYFVLIQYCAG